MTSHKIAIAGTGYVGLLLAHAFSEKYWVNILQSNSFECKKKYDAVVVAVAHKQFKVLTRDAYVSLLRDTPVIIDIKGIVEDPTWRL
jgi:UDP-N-acetyl-D-galactosamine dehydrogenase